MTRLAIIDLDVDASGRTGRAFLDRELLKTITTDELERNLADAFVQPEDEARMQLLERLLSENQVVQVSIHPGELSPPEYHVYLSNPHDPKVPLFACVLAPLPVISQLLEEPPFLLFETATFQALFGDSTHASMVAAVEAWARRVWPGLKLPRFDVRPWPLQHVPEAVDLPKKGPRKPLGAPTVLPQGDYPTREELSA